MGTGKSISNLKIKNLYEQFKGIKIENKVNDKSRKVNDYNFCLSLPKIRNQPKLVGLSKCMLNQLDLDFQEIKNSQQSAFYLSGSKLLQNSKPIANNYCGFQFGSWAGQLGDGRAHTLGQLQINKQIYQLQLKGSGLTPFSRHADGNSVVSSALRQFLASQLMHGLNVPTSRAASLVIANQQVIRDPFYNGNLKVQNAAIMLRICSSFLRFGSVQVCLQKANMTRQNPIQNRKILLPLFDYLLKHCYPQISSDQGDPYQAMYKVIVQRTAQLVAHWQVIGFVHGVLNTDNMSLVNITIDYGPFAFIDYFSKDYVSNATDEHQRYSYRRQPQIIKWNLNKLAEAMNPIVPTSILQKYLNQNYNTFYQQKYYHLMSLKLGIHNVKQNKEVIDGLFDTMDICSSHFTNVFRIFEKYFSKDSKQLTTQAVIQELLIQSIPTQYYLKNLRAFPALVNKPYSQILQYDNAFNIYFIKQQQKRVKLLEKLHQQSCQERSLRQKQLWSLWLNRYMALKPQIKQHTNPKYVLLNDIAKKINHQLVGIKNNKEQVQYLCRIVDVFQKPYHKDQWFQTTFWKHRPYPLKLTCSS